MQQWLCNFPFHFFTGCRAEVPTDTGTCRSRPSRGRRGCRSWGGGSGHRCWPRTHCTDSPREDQFKVTTFFLHEKYMPALLLHILQWHTRGHWDKCTTSVPCQDSAPSWSPASQPRSLRDLRRLSSTSHSAPSIQPLWPWRMVSKYPAREWTFRPKPTLHWRIYSYYFLPLHLSASYLDYFRWQLFSIFVGSSAKFQKLNVVLQSRCFVVNIFHLLVGQKPSQTSAFLAQFLNIWFIGAFRCYESLIFLPAEDEEMKRLLFSLTLNPICFRSSNEAKSSSLTLSSFCKSSESL